MIWVWPWSVWRQYRCAMRDLAVEHARQRADFTKWQIEVEYHLCNVGDSRDDPD